MPRPRKPEVLHELAGDPSKRSKKERQARNSTQPSGKAQPPKVMSPGAAIVWKRLVAAMPEEVYRSSDERLMAAYCEAVARHDDAVADYIANPTITVPGSTGQPTENPALKIMRAQALAILSLGRQLGLDPLSRQSINSNPTAEENEFSGLIQ